MRINALGPLGIRRGSQRRVGWHWSADAENAVAIAVLRTGDDRAVVTVQARTAPNANPDHDFGCVQLEPERLIRDAPCG